MYKWDEMSPRERDALVAEKVMGYGVFNLGLGTYNPVIREGDSWSRSVPSYTESISAAWELVEKLKPTHSFELRVGKYAESARFTQQLGVGDGSEFIVQREHAPESICLAALRAVGVEIE